MVSTRPGMCNWGGIDHLCSIATPEGQEDDKQPCCFAVLCGLQGVLVCASSPCTTTQVEHDIVSWQVCPGGNLQLVHLRMMAVECWCNVAQWCYCNCHMLTLNQIECSALALYYCRDDLTINDVILRLVAFTTGLYAFVIAMIGALAPQHLSRCNDVKHFDGAPGAIAVALAVILIVKANENRISYGNTIELNFLLSGLNSLLRNVVNNVCLRPFHVRTCECICLWPY